MVRAVLETVDKFTELNSSVYKICGAALARFGKQPTALEVALALRLVLLHPQNNNWLLISTVLCIHYNVASDTVMVSHTATSRVGPLLTVLRAHRKLDVHCA
jgi:hypothetical protein